MEASTLNETPVSAAIFWIARWHKTLAGTKLRQVGLFPGQEILLMRLWDQDGLAQKELLETIPTDHSALTRSLKRMEAQGLVRTTKSDLDRRQTLVWLTPKGRSLEPAIRSIWKEVEGVTVAMLSEEQRRTLVDIAGIVERNKENA